METLKSKKMLIHFKYHPLFVYEPYHVSLNKYGEEDGVDPYYELTLEDLNRVSENHDGRFSDFRLADDIDLDLSLEDYVIDECAADPKIFKGSSDEILIKPDWLESVKKIYSDLEDLLNTEQLMDLQEKELVVIKDDHNFILDTGDSVSYSDFDVLFEDFFKRYFLKASEIREFLDYVSEDQLVIMLKNSYGVDLSSAESEVINSIKSRMEWGIGLDQLLSRIELM